MKAFQIISNINNEVCANGIQDPDGSIHFTVEGDEFHQDPDMAEGYFSMIQQVGYRIEYQE